MNTIIYTNKGISKLQSFTNLNDKACMKLIRRAYANGINLKDLSSEERHYFESYINSSNRTALIYGDYCYVFAGSYCINVLRQPKKRKYRGKDKIKNLKKYSKHYDAKYYTCA